jgi:CDP-paratose synthetase
MGNYMKILITGATGFLGKHLTRALLQAGHQIAIVIRTASKIEGIATNTSQLKVFLLEQDPLNKIFSDFDGFDAIIHTVTCYGRNQETPEQIFGVNTLFPLRLLQTASKFQTKVFINTDTILYKFINEYALSKKQFAEWGQYFAAQGRIGFLNLQLAQFYGPDGDESKFPTYVVKSLLKNVPELQLTLGAQKRDFININDVVKAYLILLHNIKPYLNAYTDLQLGSGLPVTIREFVETAHQLTGSRTFLNFGALPYRKYEMDEPPLDTRSLQALGWSNQTTLREGIAEMVKYFQSTGEFQGSEGHAEN